MPSSSAVYRPCDAIVDTSRVLFGTSSSKRSRSFEYEMDPASSLISPSSSSSNNNALVVYDANMQPQQPMTKADPSYQRMKKQRKRRTAVAGASGVIVGAAIGGPVGAICCGAAGAATARKIGKMQAKRAVRRSEKTSFRAAALDPKRAVHKSVLV